MAVENIARSIQTLDRLNLVKEQLGIIYYALEENGKADLATLASTASSTVLEAIEKLAKDLGLDPGDSIFWRTK